MGARGPGRKPVAVRELAGTVRKDRLDTVEFAADPITTPPPPPDWLPTNEAIAEWKKLSVILVNTGILTEVMLMPLANLCALAGELSRIWAAGDRPTADLITQYRSLCNDFGLTPAGAGRIKKPEKRKVENPFEKFKRPN